MKSKVEQPIALICTFTWIGFVCAISSLEAWLKFRAPGVTLPIGLGIGRLVFAALNKVEWVFAVAILISNIRVVKKISISPFYILVVLVLILQTVWLLPALDARAELYSQDKPVPYSNLHFYYVIAEGVKIISLFIFGTQLFKLEKV
ncbi:MAG: hypothetical protein REI64_12785 [Pedobacter sp.]|uniref:hypothetical protein n=1 Tax=Pedobacter sp. TaxID=1411316 RepID=UPI002808F1E5|nr:hypothetical protein [Pedobacter sp.]MDQ8005672.1 hypothetical protein [Pedobacter sp.]